MGCRPFGTSFENVSRCQVCPILSFQIVGHLTSPALLTRTSPLAVSRRIPRFISGPTLFACIIHQSISVCPIADNEKSLFHRLLISV